MILMEKWGESGKRNFGSDLKRLYKTAKDKGGDYLEEVRDSYDDMKFKDYLPHLSGTFGMLDGIGRVSYKYMNEMPISPSTLRNANIGLAVGFALWNLNKWVGESSRGERKDWETYAARALQVAGSAGALAASTQDSMAGLAVSYTALVSGFVGENVKTSRERDNYIKELEMENELKDAFILGLFKEMEDKEIDDEIIEEKKEKFDDIKRILENQN